MPFLSLRRFGADNTGSILILTGLTLLFLFAIGGAGYDLGRQQLVKQRMQQAGDAAALAGASLPSGTTDDERRAVATAFFLLNYPESYLGVARPTPGITITDSTYITVTSASTVPTAFVVNFDITTLDVAAKSVAQIKQNLNKIDLILAMDNSNSMNSMDVGATNFLDGYLPDMLTACVAEFSNPLQVAALGFDYSPYCVYPYAFPTTDWGFFGPTRINALRYAADKLADSFLNPNPNDGDHRLAIVKWDNMLIGFSDFSTDYPAIRTELMRMLAGANTNSAIGMAKALDLSEGFRPDAVHVVVLLTDGINSMNDLNIAETILINDATIAVCNMLKAQPRTLVYTVAFGTVVEDPIVRQFLSDCATGPNGTDTPKPNENLYFYSAADADALNDAFARILSSLRKVRIVQ